MQARRNSTDPMDLSGRSTNSNGSATGRPTGFPMPQLMGQVQQPHFQPGYGQQGFPGPSSPRFFQMQMQQQQQQQQQQMRQMPQQLPPSSPRNSQYQQAQLPPQPKMPSQPRRNSGGSGIAPAPLTRPPPIRPLDSATKTSTSTPSLTPTSTSNSSKMTATAPPKAPTTTTSTNKSLPTTTTTNQPSAQPPAPPKPKTKTKHSADPPMTFEQQAVLLAQTDWIDRTPWVSRQLFGGQALNGFLRATARATAQRVKKQLSFLSMKKQACSCLGPYSCEYWVDSWRVESWWVFFPMTTSR